jgi:hypothetical protein
MYLSGHRSKFIQTLSLLLLISVVSCKEEKPPLAEYGPVVQHVLKTELRTFRGNDLGDSMDSVMYREGQNPIEADDHYLYYEYKTADSSASYRIAYDFDEQGLAEMQTEIFITTPAQTDTVLAGFKNYFNKHFGAYQDHMGFLVWTVNSEKYGPVRINLTDESSDLTAAGGPGKISLWIYPDKE